MTEPDVFELIAWQKAHPEITIVQAPDGTFHAVVAAGTDSDPRAECETLPERIVTQRHKTYTDALRDVYLKRR